MAIMIEKVIRGRILTVILILQLKWRLIIAAEPVIRAEPVNRQLIGRVGERASLWCYITQGDPGPTVTWNRENADIVGRGEELKFDQLKKTDEGSYTCMATNNVATKSIVFKVNVYDVSEVVVSYAGESARLKNVHGNEGFVLTWYNTLALPGTEVNNTNKVATWTASSGRTNIKQSDYDVDPNTGDLLINQVTEKEGTYTAKMLILGQGDSYKYATLHVYIPPSRVTMRGLDQAVIENEETTITCSVPRVKPENVTFEWSLTNNGNIISGAIQTYSNNTDGTYRVISTLRRQFKRRDDSDSLKCVAKHGADPERSASSEGTIVVHYPYKVETQQKDEDELPIRGKNKTLTCKTIDVGKPVSNSIYWYKNGGDALTQRSKYIGTSSPFMTILSLEDSDAGTYECRIVNAAGSGLSRVHYTLYKVLYAPLINMVCPGPINESMAASIQCNIDAVPEVQSSAITWSFEGDIMDTTGSIYQLTDTSRSDRGVYTCTAVNSIGPATDTCNIVVNYGPTGTPNITADNFTVMVGKHITLTCNTDGMDHGFPVARQYIWKKDDNVLRHGSKIYSFTPSLVTDGGEYACAFKNTYGESKFGKRNVSIEAPMTIENETALQTFKPRFDDAEFVISFVVSGTSARTYTLKNSSQDVTNTYFTRSIEKVQGQFSYGQDKAQRINWKWNLNSAYLQNCTSITFYNGDYNFFTTGEAESTKTALIRIEVQYPPLWGMTSMVQSSPLEVSKTLLCDVCAEPAFLSYEWRFKGEKQVGTSQELEIATVSSDNFGWYICTARNSVGQKMFNITLEERGSPHAPYNFKVSSETSTTLLVTWSVAFDGGFALKKFELIVNDGGMDVKHDITECLTKKECEFRIRELTAEKRYFLKVRAQNTWENADHSYSEYAETQGMTLASPSFVPLAPEIEETYMKVKWLYEPRPAYIQKSGNQEVGLVVSYKKEGDEDYIRYPAEDKIPLRDQSARIDGSFDPSSKYHIAYKLYEGTEEAQMLEPELIAGVSSGPSHTAAIAGAVVGVILVALLIAIIVIVLRRSRRKRPRSDMDKNSSSGYRPVPHSASAESIPIRPPMLIPASAGRHEHNSRPPIPGSKPTVGPPTLSSRNGVKHESPYENSTPPYANVKNRNKISSSQTSLYDNAQYEDVEFSKNKEKRRNPEGVPGPEPLYTQVGPKPTKRKSKIKNPSSEEEDEPSGLMYADLMFDQQGQPTHQPEPEEIHGVDQRVDYASLDFDQMKAKTNPPRPPMYPMETESPYFNVLPGGKPV